MYLLRKNVSLSSNRFKRYSFTFHKMELTTITMYWKSNIIDTCISYYSYHLEFFFRSWRVSSKYTLDVRKCFVWSERLSGWVCKTLTTVLVLGIPPATGAFGFTGWESYHFRCNYYCTIATWQATSFPHLWFLLLDYMRCVWAEISV